MCGIAGFIDFKERPTLRILSKMLSSITYRGPDSSGSFLDDEVVLGVRRLKIIDLATGDQPITNEDGSIIVVYNGEIYNYQELREELLQTGHKLKTQSDTETLVHLYEDYGESFPKKLNGMFAFALWDKKKKKLLLGRDHVGVKPIFYWYQGKTLIFGSEIKTILMHPKVKREINEESVELFKALTYVPGKKTIFRNIFKLDPGTTLSFTSKGVLIKTYWTIWNNPKTDLSLDDLFADTVKRQLIADVPTGLFLSGGVDSTILTYYAVKYKRRIKTFSIGFDEPHADETKYAQTVAKLFGTEHYAEKFTASDMETLLPEIVSKTDEPIGDPSFFPVYKLSLMTRKQVTVAINGTGGDELFGGYETYRGIFSRLSYLLPEVVTKTLSKTNKLFHVHSPYYERSPEQERFFSGLGLSFPARHLYWTSGIDDKQYLSIIQDLCQETWVKDVEKHLDAGGYALSQKLQILDFFTILRESFLPVTDRASMLNSLEVRVPFLDKRIISWAYQPGKIHANILQRRILFNRFVKDKIPDEVIQRPKKGFTLPLGGWVRNKLNNLIRQRLAYKPLYQFYDKTMLFKSLALHEKKIENHARMLWTAAMFSAWLENWGD